MKVKFDSQNNPGFHAAVRKEVDNYFKQNAIGKNANAEMVLKTVLFLSLLIGFYALIISNAFDVYTMLVFAILLGMVQAFIGFNVCHDAIHGSYSSNRKVNKILSYVFNVIGANAYVWDITHNKVHHTYTNIPGHDEDLEVAPGLICMSPTEKPKAIMRFQHIYAFFLYSLTSLSWVLRKDFKKFFQKKIGETDNSKHAGIEYFNLFFFKLLYYTLFIVIPLIVLDITWWQFIIGFLAMHLAEGLVLGLVFQLAHVVEGISFPEPSSEGKIEESWAIHQMNTTADFARKSTLAKFFCGGLNFQIEHHLFPNICHVHYPAISHIVKATAIAHNVPYHENETFFGALQSHYRALKHFGRQ
ncbi:acyl-CoA desaturase [Fulvivirgaceae bacterium BMA10]|uniref:Acyl-CoA desaturase n=1 Tax=Splendidivirga corallicola TaxID=3051826 RepID=A0ABT8KXT3_9BACT|nr:acyl-CoA desaturase [Fulvivirgaceae bacterium BMA10]